MAKCEGCNYEYNKTYERKCPVCGAEVCEDCHFEDGCEACEGG